MSLVQAITELAKLPFVLIGKLFFNVLNLIPTDISEFHTRVTRENQAGFRNLHSVIRGKRRLHLGFVIVAYLRGAIFSAKYGAGDEECRGVWVEDYQDIVRKWGL